MSETPAAGCKLFLYLLLLFWPRFWFLGLWFLELFLQLFDCLAGLVLAFRFRIFGFLLGSSV